MKENLNLIGGQSRRGIAGQIISYKNDAPLSVIKNDGYFNDLKSILNIGDLIDVYSTNSIEGGSMFLRVIAMNPDVIVEEGVDLTGYYTKTEADALLINKVDKDGEKVLSENDYTTTDKEKLDSLENYDDTQIKADIDTKAPLFFADKFYITRATNTTATIETTKPTLAPENYLEFTTVDNTKALAFTITHNVGIATTLTKNNSFGIDTYISSSSSAGFELSYLVKHNGVAISSEHYQGRESISLGAGLFYVLNIPRMTLPFDLINESRDIAIGDTLTIEAYIRQEPATPRTFRIYCGATIGGSDYFSCVDFNFTSVSLNTSNIADGAITEEKLSESVQTKLNVIDDSVVALNKTWSSDEISKSKSYSLTETWTGGYWIDGKKIYQKTVFISALGEAGDTIQTPHEISNVDLWVGMNAISSDGLTLTPIPFVTHNSVADNIAIQVTSVYVETTSGVNRTEMSAYVTLQYTCTDR